MEEAGFAAVKRLDEQGRAANFLVDHLVDYL